MPHLLLILTAFLGLTVTSFGQRKLTFYTTNDSYVFRKGFELGITLKGQPYLYGNWKTICKPCDSVVQKNLWTIDSLAQNSFVLSKIDSYSYDTVSYKAYSAALKTGKKKRKELPVIENSFYRDTVFTRIVGQDTVKVTEQKEMLVLKIPNITRQTVYYDSIQSITCSHLDSEEGCSRGFIIFPAVVSALGVYQLIAELSKKHPDNRILLLAAASMVSGAIMTDTAIDIRKNNVETIQVAYWKWKVK